ncbi:major facilitator superfamily domain-containing protein [Xylariales sp. PMI_506]|nr:major facilitator superfamily domain-containing protein [Xylariales sp. PMI_506]
MASTTMTSTTSAIPLSTLNRHGVAGAGVSNNVITQRPVAAASSQSLRGADSDTDPVLEASRVADNAAPDGGRGWVVVAACAVVGWWFVGIPYSWGVMQSALVDQGGSPATLAFVGSLSCSLISALAIVNARVIRWLGSQRTAMLGVSFLGLSALTSSFSVDNIAGLFFTSGVLLGFGLSLCFMTVSVTPAQYFSRKRGLANGIVFAGGGLGGAVMSYTIDILIQKYSLAWAYRVVAIATFLTGLPAAWLIRELNPIRTAGFIDWRLFKDPGFLLVFSVGAVGTFPLFVPPFFIPLYAKSMGLSSSTGAGLLAAFNFSSAVGRIFCGYLCDRIGPLNALFAALCLTAISMLAMWPVSTTLVPLAIFVVINGAANGGFFATMPTVVGNTFGSARVSVAMGMIVTGWVGGYLMGAPIAGYLLDAYGGSDSGLQAYRPAIFFAGSLALAAAALVTVMRFRTNRSLFAKV